MERMLSPQKSLPQEIPTSGFESQLNQAMEETVIGDIDENGNQILLTARDYLDSTFFSAQSSVREMSAIRQNGGDKLQILKSFLMDGLEIEVNGAQVRYIIKQDLLNLYTNMGYIVLEDKEILNEKGDKIGYSLVVSNELDQSGQPVRNAEIKIYRDSASIVPREITLKAYSPVIIDHIAENQYEQGYITNIKSVLLQVSKDFETPQIENVGIRKA